MGTTYNEGKAVYISGSGLLMSLATGGFSKNSQWWYFAWKNLQWGFCYVGYCCPSFIVVFKFLSYFSMPPALQPGFSGLWRPLSSLSSTLATLDCFCFFIYHKRYGFEWAFFTHSCFLLCAPSLTFLTLPAFIKVSLGASSSSLKFSGFHADPQNRDLAHLFVRFTAIHNLQIQKNTFLNCTKNYHELLVVKV